MYNRDTNLDNQLHTTFNSYLVKHGLENYINDMLRIIFYDYEQHYRDNCLHKLTYLLNKDKTNVNGLKKYHFAYGYHFNDCPYEFSLILLLKNKKHRDQALKDGNLIEIKEKCFNLLKTLDGENYFSADNFIFYLGYDGLVTKPDRGNDVCIRGNEALIKV